MKISYSELKVNDYIIRGLFSTPDNGKYKTVVVFLHGYTGHKNETSFLFKQLSARFVEEGMATLRYDYYGSGDSDGEFHNQTFTTARNDAKAAIDEAVRLNNGKKIIVCGFSMGGAVAARMSIEKADLIEKLVLISPAGCMLNILTTTFRTRQIVENNCIDLGGYYVSKDFLDSLMGVEFYEGLEKFTSPVIIVQGTEDVSVKPEVSKKYTEYYPNCEYVLIEGAGHGYNSVPIRRQIQSIIVDFLKK